MDIWDALASNPKCPPGVLAELADPPNSFGRAITSPRYPVEHMRKKAASDDPNERCLVADNPKCPPDLVEQLSQDPDPSVRAIVSRRTDLPVPTQRRLLQDGDHFVQQMAIRGSVSSRALIGAYFDLRAKHDSSGAELIFNQMTPATRFRALMKEFMQERKRLPAGGKGVNAR